MKKIATYILLVIIACAQTVSAQNWTKKDLIKAGFKFKNAPYSASQHLYSPVIYGKKINGKLNGIVILGDKEDIQLGYMVNGEMAFPFIDAHIGKYNFLGINENQYCYNAEMGAQPMTFIVDEIFGIKSFSPDTRIDLCNGDFDINHIIHSFNQFITSGQRIPDNAWVGHLIKINGITCVNSNPLKIDDELNYSNNVDFKGPYEISCWDRAKREYSVKSQLEENLPSNFDLRIFKISLEYNPSNDKASGDILRINRIFEIGVENGCIIIKSENFSKQIWNTGCQIQPGIWNDITVFYKHGTIFVQTNNCMKLASFHFNNYNFKSFVIRGGESIDNYIGKIRNIALSYYRQ